MQARYPFQEEAAAEGKSTVSDVMYHTASTWGVKTLQWGGVERQSLGYFSSQEEAEAVAETYFPRLEAAAAEGKLDDALAEVRAELAAQV